MRASARELLVPFFTPLVWCGRGIRTHDLPLRKRTLYQLSYRGGILYKHWLGLFFTIYSFGAGGGGGQPKNVMIDDAAYNSTIRVIIRKILILIG